MTRISFVFIAILALAATTLHAQWGWNGVRGNGNMQKETRKIDGFKSVSSRGSVDLRIRQGASFSVEVEAESNILPLIETKVVGTELRVGITPGSSVSTTKNMVAYITMPNIEGISVSGSGDVYGESTFKADKLNLSVTGSGDMNLTLQVKDLNSRISGSGNFTLRGTAESHSIDIMGSGDMRALDLVTDKVNARVMGSGNADLNATKEITARVSGSGDITYKGKPSMVDVDARGSGSVRRRD
jgi:hypothetical protein